MTSENAHDIMEGDKSHDVKWLQYDFSFVKYEEINKKCRETLLLPIFISYPSLKRTKAHLPQILSHILSSSEQALMVRRRQKCFKHLEEILRAKHFMLGYSNGKKAI